MCEPEPSLEDELDPNKLILKAIFANLQMPPANLKKL